MDFDHGNIPRRNFLGLGTPEVAGGGAADVYVCRSG
jgi:hypothetical protein